VLFFGLLLLFFGLFFRCPPEKFSADALGEEGVLQMRVSALFGAKKLRIFWNLWCIRTDKGGRGVEPVLTFCGQREREGQFFAILYGRLLWMAPNLGQNFSKEFVNLFQLKYECNIEIVFRDFLKNNFLELRGLW